MVSTGGTIASTVDYRTGVATARFDAEDVLRALVDLAGRANYRDRVVANGLGENATSAVWQDLARAVHEERGEAHGVVVLGTDTMQFTASALAFVLDAPAPSSSPAASTRRPGHGGSWLEGGGVVGLEWVGGSADGTESVIQYRPADDPRRPESAGTGVY